MYFYLYVKIKLYICSVKTKEIITIKTLKIMIQKEYITIAAVECGSIMKNRYGHSVGQNYETFVWDGMGYTKVKFFVPESIYCNYTKISDNNEINYCFRKIAYWFFKAKLREQGIKIEDVKATTIKNDAGDFFACISTKDESKWKVLTEESPR